MGPYQTLYHCVQNQLWMDATTTESRFSPLALSMLEKHLVSPSVNVYSASQKVKICRLSSSSDHFPGVLAHCSYELLALDTADRGTFH